MINQVFQLVAPRQIGVRFDDVSLGGDKVVVRPTHLSICAADQRYYTGKRDPEYLKKKLPMALIHEAAGVVAYDGAGEFKTGENVILIPNTPRETDDYVAENYLPTSGFRSSGMDGFMQEYVLMDRDRIIRFDGMPPEVAAVCELVSVAMHAVDSFMKQAHGRRGVIGVWGDGNLGYVVSLMLLRKIPDARIAVIGMDPYKMSFFSFADSVYPADALPEGFAVDHAFECVGGQSSAEAISQIVGAIRPEGTVTLLGVSETSVPIPTRMVLEKGLRLVGRSRSGRRDFIETAKFLETDMELQARVRKIIREVVPVNGFADIIRAFEQDLSQAFKTVLRWNI